MSRFPTSSRGIGPESTAGIESALFYVSTNPLSLIDKKDRRAKRKRKRYATRAKTGALT